MHGSFDETGAHDNVMHNHNAYNFQQHHQNMQHQAALAQQKMALAQPMRAAVGQRPYNYHPAVAQNYQNQNLYNHNGQYYIQPQHYRGGL